MVMDAMANLEHEDPRFQRLELTVLGDGPKRKILRTTQNSSASKPGF